MPILVAFTRLSFLLGRQLPLLCVAVPVNHSVRSQLQTRTILANWQNRVLKSFLSLWGYEENFVKPFKWTKKSNNSLQRDSSVLCQTCCVALFTCRVWLFLCFSYPKTWLRRKIGRPQQCNVSCPWTWKGVLFGRCSIPIPAEKEDGIGTIRLISTFLKGLVYLSTVWIFLWIGCTTFSGFLVS